WTKTCPGPGAVAAAAAAAPASTTTSAAAELQKRRVRRSVIPYLLFERLEGLRAGRRIGFRPIRSRRGHAARDHEQARPAPLLGSPRSGGRAHPDPRRRPARRQRAEPAAVAFRRRRVAGAEGRARRD